MVQLGPDQPYMYLCLRNSTIQVKFISIIIIIIIIIFIIIKPGMDWTNKTLPVV